MTAEETPALQAHLEAAAILFTLTPSEQLQEFESLERHLRQPGLEQVRPRMGNFLGQRQRYAYLNLMIV
jgi:hypothetical protein